MNRRQATLALLGAAFAPAARKAFEGARSLMLEFVPDGYSRARFLEAAMFQDAQTLEEKIGAQGRAFIALGALHLYGEDGVLARLGADGYRATRVL